MSLESRASQLMSTLSPYQQMCVNCSAYYNVDDTDEALIAKAFVQCCYRPSLLARYFVNVDPSIPLLVRTERLTAADPDVVAYATTHLA